MMTRLLEITGFKTPGELFSETNGFERHYLMECVKERERMEGRKLKKMLGK